MGKWYVNKSQKPQTVEIDGGNVVAVKPGDRIEVNFESEGLKRLVKTGKMARTGRIVNAIKEKNPDRKPVEKKELEKKTLFAKSIKEIVAPKADKDKKEEVAKSDVNVIDSKIIKKRRKGKK